MGRFFVFAAVMIFLLVFLTARSGAIPGLPPGPESPMADTVYVDDFNRAGPGLGSAWTADTVYQIVSNEMSNTDTVGGFDDLAVYNSVFARSGSSFGASFRWGTGADTTGMVNGGLALMMDAASATSNGYFLFRNFNLNWYALWTIENGVVTTQLANSSESELDYFKPGDEFQVAITTDVNGHHFDIFINDQFDVRLTDPNKVQGNADTLYAGVVLEGGQNNNVDDFTFFKYSDDTIPPSAVGDLSVYSRTPSSITLTWSAPGDDDTTGTASRYDVRYSQSQISELNFDNATQALSEPVPSPYGTTEYFTVSGLDPDTRYYFALKSDDGWPQRNISGISNIVSGWTSDNIAPSAVSDLSVSSVTSRTALLTWTATGDNDTVGVADWYDVRYSTIPITESNFASASQAVGEPDPLPSGSAEEFTVGGLDAGTTYYFAIKVMDESDNSSPLSNVPFEQTAIYPVMTGYFERPPLGSGWGASPECGIVIGAPA